MASEYDELQRKYGVGNPQFMGAGASKEDWGPSALESNIKVLMDASKIQRDPQRVIAEQFTGTNVLGLSTDPRSFVGSGASGGYGLPSTITAKPPVTQSPTAGVNLTKPIQAGTSAITPPVTEARTDTGFVGAMETARQGRTYTGEPVTEEEGRGNVEGRIYDTPGAGLPDTTMPTGASTPLNDWQESQIVQNTYKQAITQMMERGAKLSDEIQRGLYSGQRLTASLDQLKDIQGMLPNILSGYATSHKGIMDINVEKLIKGEIPMKELQYKLGLLPLEIEEKKAKIGVEKASAVTKRKEGEYYIAHAEEARKRAAGMPSSFDAKTEAKIKEQEAKRDREKEWHSQVADVLRSQNTPEDKRQAILSIMRIYGEAAIYAKDPQGNNHILDKDGNVIF